MATPAEPQPYLRFGEFELDLHARELRSNGKKLNLQEQPFQVLAILLERPGELVTRDELMKRLWPSDTFVDFDHSLNKAVNRLREVLGDSAGNPILIGTVPRRGYRFLLPVNPVEVRVQGSSDHSIELSGIHILPDSGTPDRKPFPWPIASYIALGVLVVLVASAILSTRQRETALQLVPVTTLPGWEGDSSFSPDGSEIAFDYLDENDRSDIYMKVLGDEKTVRLTVPPGESAFPSWSPDGQNIAYVYSFPGAAEAAIMLMTPVGGSKRILRRVPAEWGHTLSWSPDGQLLATDLQTSTDSGSGISLISLAGSPDRKLTHSTNAHADNDPAFSPDGRQIAFRRINDALASDIYVLELSAASPQRITFINATAMSGPVWTSDGNRILFSADIPVKGAGGPAIHGVYSVSSRGGLLEQLPLDSDVRNPVTSRRGNKLACQKIALNANIWRLPLGAGAGGIPSKLIASSRAQGDPDFSPDGSKVTFASTRDGTSAIWISDTDGQNPIRVATVNEGSPAWLPVGHPAWSPDGKRIAFASFNVADRQIKVLDLETGVMQPLTRDGTRFTEATPSWSADGKWIYFSSDRTHRLEVWKASLATGEAIQLTKNGGISPHESSDRTFVYYNKGPLFSSTPKGLWKIPAADGQEELVIADAEKTWRVTSQGIYFMQSSAGARTLLKFRDFATKTTRVVGQFEAAASRISGLAIAPDGRTALYSQIDSRSSDIVLVKGGTW